MMLDIILDFTEILKLKRMLEDAAIDFEFKYLNGGYQVLLTEGKIPFLSAVTSIASYGRERGLIEIMGLLEDEELEENSVVGWIDAENVFQRIMKHFQNKSKIGVQK